MPSPSIPELSEISEQAQKERQQLESETREIDVLVKQTTGEVERLQQRQTEFVGRLRQLDANLESFSRDEIKNIYAGANDAQMRLFMMRNQLEQLQTKQRNIQRFRAQLERVSLLAEQVSEASATFVIQGDDSHGSDQQSIIQIIEAQEVERQHLARQMHDGPAQSLTNLILQAEIVERLFDTDLGRARTELDNLKNTASTTFQRIRDFIFDLRPMMLDDLGLIPTLKRFTQTYETKTHLPTHLQTTGEHTLSSYVEVTLFRAIQELLNNIARHAHASRVHIALDMQADPVVLTVEDDGTGFDVENAMATARQRGSSGLATIEKRVQMLGGKVQVQSGTGRGTRVRIELPAS